MSDHLTITLHQAHWWALLVSWGNIGSAVAGLAALILAGAAIIGGQAGLGDWREKQRTQGALAEEERENLRLDRQRILNGWTANGLPVYGVELVNSPAEMEQAIHELSHDAPSDYVLLRVNESQYGNEIRAHNLRQLITSQGYLTRAPERGEYEALERGRKILADEGAAT